jgi:hypothetical protein
MRDVVGVVSTRSRGRLALSAGALLVGLALPILARLVTFPGVADPFSALSPDDGWLRKVGYFFGAKTLHRTGYGYGFFFYVRALALTSAVCLVVARLPWKRPANSGRSRLGFWCWLGLLLAISFGPLLAIERGVLGLPPRVESSAVFALATIASLGLVAVSLPLSRLAGVSVVAVGWALERVLVDAYLVESYYLQGAFEPMVYFGARGLVVVTTLAAGLVLTLRARLLPSELRGSLGACPIPEEVALLPLAWGLLVQNGSSMSQAWVAALFPRISSVVHSNWGQLVLFSGTCLIGTLALRRALSARAPTSPAPQRSA